MSNRYGVAAKLAGSIAMLALMPAAVEAQMSVAVDGYVIFDGGIGDLEPNGNNIRFDSLAPPPDGFATNSGFDATGRVLLTTVAGALGGQLNTGQALVLTEFVADMPASGTPGPFNIIFEHDFNLVLIGGGTAADVVVAFAHDGTLEPPYMTGGGAIPLLGGEDTLLAWQGYVDGVPIPNPTAPLPPSSNVAGLNMPYQTHGHATINPLFGGLIFDAILRGELSFSLGGPRNQFILLTSAEVGLEDLDPLPISIPMLSTTGTVVLVLGLLGGIILATRFITFRGDARRGPSLF